MIKKKNKYKIQKIKQLNQVNYSQIFSENQLQIQSKSTFNSQQIFQIQINQFKSTQINLKQKINDLSQELQFKQTKINELIKQSHFNKLKIKQLQENLFKIEIEKNQQDIQINKIDKENKKIKKDLLNMEEKYNQIQEEKENLTVKYQQATKNYKYTKRELQKLKEQMSDVNQFQQGSKDKINKIQQSLKITKNMLNEKNEHCKNLEQKIKSIEIENQNSKNQYLKLKYLVQQTNKKYEIVSEARTILEEKLVLQRQQSSKNMANMIKQKDICSRQNYKLLQMLQIKDKTIEKIFNGLKNPSQLQKDFNLELTSKQNHSQKIIDQIVNKEVKTNKQRISLIDQYLQKI